jgi:ABC-2 type transport system ATP-binding protein
LFDGAAAVAEFQLVKVRGLPSAAMTSAAGRRAVGEPAATPAGAVEVRDLTIRYGDLTAVDRISFAAPAGTVLALLGPNGAGKTSTVEALEGYRRPAAGQVRVLGLDPVADHDALTRRMGVMLQEGGVYTGARPPEVLRLFAAYHDDPADPAELLARVGLADRARTTWRHLSGGERQRLSLALALVGRPEIVFLDEPTAGIDPAGRQLVRRIIADLRASGVTVVLTTHDLDEAEALADRVVIVDRGRVLADGTPADLRAASGGPAEDLRFGAPAGLDTAAVAVAVGGTVEEVAPGEYRAAVAPTPATVAALTAWLAEHDLPLADLRAGRQRLEDVFLRLTERSAAEPTAAPGPGGRRRRGRGRGRR